MALAFCTAAEAKTILFVGNSFTFGANSAAHYYKPDTVTDLNGPGANGKTVGGVPAIFKAFTKEAGLDYTVSLETVGGKGMDFHYAEKRALLDKAWDVVVMHGYSTLDQAHPGDPALLVSSAKQMTDMFRAKNPRAEVWLDATWSRADQTYPADKPWHGKPIQQMGRISQLHMTWRRRTRMPPAWCRSGWPGTAPSMPAWRETIPMPAYPPARSICGPGTAITPAPMAITWKR
jgi:hypothetical protein